MSSLFRSLALSLSPARKSSSSPANLQQQQQQHHYQRQIARLWQSDLADEGHQQRNQSGEDGLPLISAIATASIIIISNTNNNQISTAGRLRSICMIIFFLFFLFLLFGFCFLYFFILMVMITKHLSPIIHTKTKKHNNNNR